MLERVALEEGLEGFLRFPLAEDDVAADGCDVLVHVGLDVAGDGLQVLDDAEEALLELLLLAGDHVVMHSDGGHNGRGTKAKGTEARRAEDRSDFVPVYPRARAPYHNRSAPANTGPSVQARR